MLARNHFSIRWLILGISLFSLLIGLGLPFLPLHGSRAQSDPPPVELNEDVIKRATVFIMQTYRTPTQTVISCIGSGTLVSADGLILTNAHIAENSDSCQSDTLVIAVTVRLDEPPVPSYTAEIVESSKGLDLAVLRINGYLDGRVIEPGTLQLPFVELGDSTQTSLDDTITVIGYPDFGNEPVAVTRGTIEGFTAEARAGDRAWIRTSAVIPGTMSGAGVYNRDGKLIGVPTIAPARSGGEAVDCRVIQDTNQDGRADRNDRCVPVGGFISALRPSELARGLVRAATLGIRQGSDLTNPAPTVIEGEPTFSRLFFTTNINEAGLPSNVVGSVPSGTTSLYLFFDYDHMVDGMIYELRVTVNDLNEAAYSLPPVTWSGGRRGTWYIGASNTPWKNGLYFFRLYVEGREVASKSIEINGGPLTLPSFSDIIFGVLDGGGGLVGTNYVLPQGSIVQARFAYHNMQPGINCGYVWYRDGQQMGQMTEAWPEDRGAQGTWMTSVQAESAIFTAGQYRLELYIDNLLSATADFVVAGRASGTTTQIFVPTAESGPVFRFVTGDTGGAPGTESRVEFPAGIENLYVFFNWSLLAPGTPWTRRWAVDGDTLFEVTEPWDAAPDGENFFTSLDSLSSLPDGTYEFSISIANVPIESAAVKVGLGQLPVGSFASASGVQMVGRITDAETGEGIPGALFIVLKSEYSVEDFLWDESQVLGKSLADSGGRFQIPVLLPRGTMDEPLLYSVLVRAEGYLPVNGDGIIVIDTTQSPIELNIALTHN